MHVLFLPPRLIASLALTSPFACGGSTILSGSGDASTDSGVTLVDASLDDASLVDSSPVDATPTCSPSMQVCAGVCVDTTSDPGNCGTCGHACSVASACANAACQPNGLPIDPGGPPGDGAGSVVLAFSKLYLGDTDRNGITGQRAWEQYGLNLDGRTTDPFSTDVCTLTAGASKSTQGDGANGIDNSWGENILPIFLTLSGQDFATKNNDAIRAGALTMMVKIDRLGAQSSYSPLLSAPFGGASLGSTPLWNGNDVWPVDTSTVTNGDITMPKLVFTNGYMTNRVWVSGRISGRITLRLSIRGVELRIPLDHAVLTMNVDPNNQSATNGTLAAVMPTEDFILAFKQFAGQISTSLCQGSTFNSVAQQIRQANDILADGTNHAGAPCAAISFGIGFEAKRVQLGSVVTPPTTPNPCP